MPFFLSASSSAAKLWCPPLHDLSWCGGHSSAWQAWLAEKKKSLKAIDPSSNLTIHVGEEYIGMLAIDLSSNLTSPHTTTAFSSEKAAHADVIPSQGLCVAPSGSALIYLIHSVKEKPLQQVFDGLHFLAIHFHDHTLDHHAQIAKVMS